MQRFGHGGAPLIEGVRLIPADPVHLMGGLDLVGDLVEGADHPASVLGLRESEHLVEDVFQIEVQLGDHVEVVPLLPRLLIPDILLFFGVAEAHAEDGVVVHHPGAALEVPHRPEFEHAALVLRHIGRGAVVLPVEEEGVDQSLGGVALHVGVFRPVLPLVVVAGLGEEGVFEVLHISGHVLDHLLGRIGGGFDVDEHALLRLESAFPVMAAHDLEDVASRDVRAFGDRGFFGVAVAFDPLRDGGVGFLAGHLLDPALGH